MKPWAHDRRVVLLGAIAALSLVATAALGTERTQMAPEPLLDDSVRRSVLDSNHVDDPSPSPEQSDAAKAAVSAERALVETNSFAALHQQVRSGNGPSGLPTWLAEGLTQDHLDAATRSGRVLVKSSADQTGSTTSEQAAFADAEGGSLIFIWQNWPSEVDLQSVLKDGTRVEYVNDIDITIFDVPGFSEVGAYDGTIYVRVVALNIEDVTVDEMTDMVESLIPVLGGSTAP